MPVGRRTGETFEHSCRLCLELHGVERPEDGDGRVWLLIINE